MAKPKHRTSPSKRARSGKNGGRRRGSGRKVKFLKEFTQVGSPPADPLRAMEWGLSLVLLALDTVRTDPDIDPKTRRAEIVRLTRNMEKLIPPARISAAERVILDAEKRRSAPPGSAEGSETLSAASQSVKAIAGGPRAGGS